MKNEMSTELKWLFEKAVVVNVYPGECITKEYVGKLPYRMWMNAIKKNEWSYVDERREHWHAVNNSNPKVEYSLYHHNKSGLTTFTINEAL